MLSGLIFLLWLFGRHSLVSHSTELCKISTAANSRWIRLWQDTAQRVNHVSGESRRLHSIPKPHHVCLPNKPPAEWDWPPVRCKHRPLKVAGPTKPLLHVPWPAPSCSDKSEPREVYIETTAWGANPPPPPYRGHRPTPGIYWLRSWGIIQFPRGEIYQTETWFSTESAKPTLAHISNFIKEK